MSPAESLVDSVPLPADSVVLPSGSTVPSHALRARDVMSAPVHVLGVMATMSDAWSVMVGSGVHHLVICDGRRCAGVLDDRTLFARWPAGPFGDRSTPLRDLIPVRTTCVLPEATLARLARVMVNEGVDAVPVTDVDGTILGIVTAGDVAAAVARYELGSHQPDQPGEPDQRDEL